MMSQWWQGRGLDEKRDKTLHWKWGRRTFDVTPHVHFFLSDFAISALNFAIAIDVDDQEVDGDDEKINEIHVIDLREDKMPVYDIMQMLTGSPLMEIVSVIQIKCG